VPVEARHVVRHGLRSQVDALEPLDLIGKAGQHFQFTSPCTPHGLTTRATAKKRGSGTCCFPSLSNRSIHFSAFRKGLWFLESLSCRKVSHNLECDPLALLGCDDSDKGAHGIRYPATPADDTPYLPRRRAAR